MSRASSSFPFLVWRETLTTPVAPNRVSRAWRRSSSSWICWRMSDLVPRCRAGQQGRGGRQALEALGVAVPQREVQVDALAPRLLGEEGDLQAVGESGAPHLRFDPLGSDVDGLSRGDGGPPLILADHRQQVGRGGHRGAFGDSVGT